MGAGSSKHYYDLLVSAEWPKGVESLTLVSDVSDALHICSTGQYSPILNIIGNCKCVWAQVCDLAEQLAAERCGKHSIKVYQKCCELRVSQAALRWRPL
jgi:hypothetical protein